MTPEIMDDGTRLLLPHEVCALLRVTPRWFRDHGKDLPGRIEITTKVVRYREDLILRWLRVRERETRASTRSTEQQRDER